MVVLKMLDSDYDGFGRGEGEGNAGVEDFEGEGGEVFVCAEDAGVNGWQGRRERCCR